MAGDVDDQSLISFNRFKQILDQFNVTIKEIDLENIALALPGRESNDSEEQMINISKIYDQKYTILLDQMYKKVD